MHTLKLVLTGTSLVLQIESLSIHPLSLLKWIVTLVRCGVKLVQRIESFSIHALSFSIWTQRLKD